MRSVVRSGVVFSDGIGLPAVTGLPVGHHDCSASGGKVSMRKTTEHRFGEKLAHDPETGCILWTAALNPKGYARFWNGHRSVPAHRWAYGEDRIPDGLVLDHLCRVRHCQNPDHLEPVTHQENLTRGNGWAGVHARKTRCPQGHPLSGENLRVKRDRRGNQRTCWICYRIQKRECIQRRKEREAAK